ncbi:MAG: hypothetical protein ACP5PS_08715 [Bacteroidales bacterium]
MAKDIAIDIVEKDSLLASSENVKLKILVSKTKKENINWSLIS